MDTFLSLAKSYSLKDTVVNTIKSKDKNEEKEIKIILNKKNQTNSTNIDNKNLQDLNGISPNKDNK